jgi:hypothetical protein
MYEFIPLVLSALFVQLLGPPDSREGFNSIYLAGGIFGRLNIMYYRLSYVSGGVLPLKPLVLYIHLPRAIMKSIQPFLQLYSPTITL